MAFRLSHRGDVTEEGLPAPGAVADATARREARYFHGDPEHNQCDDEHQRRRGLHV